MLNRDFSKPKKDYILKNKFVLLALAVIMIASIIVTSILGVNTTPEFDGGYMFSVKVGHEITDAKLEKYTKEIDAILDDNKLDVYSVQFKGEGELSSIQVTYTGEPTINKINKVNKAVSSYFKVELNNISDHEYLEPTIENEDYIYTAVACLIVLLTAVVFTIFRHNIGYALSMLGAGLMSVVSFVLLFGLIRLQATNVIFSLIILTLSLTLVQSLLLFEELKKLNKKSEFKTDLSKSLTTGMKNIAKQVEFSAIALFVVGLLFVMLGTNLTRQIAIGYLFAIVTALASFLFVLPFIYNLIMDKININKKANKQEGKTKAEKKDSGVEKINSQHSENNESVSDSANESKENKLEEKPAEETQENNTVEVVKEVADNTASSNDQK